MRPDSLISILLQVVTPVILIAGIGYLFGWRTKTEVRPISRLAFYVLIPALVFNSLSRLDWQSRGVLRMVGFSALVTIAMGVLAWLVSRIMHLQAPLSNAFMLVIMFTNGGNFGLPLNLFAFGQEGMDTALVFFVVSALLINSVGVFVASRGKAGAGKALLNVLRAPVLWAALAGVMVNLSGWAVPETVDKALQLVSQGAVPVMLLVLGMQLARISLNEHKRAIAVATVVKLVAAPALAYGLALLLGMQGINRQVGIVEASMPTAVTTTILATEFDTAPRFAASVVFVSTLLSLISLTLLLSWLR